KHVTPIAPRALCEERVGGGIGRTYCNFDAERRPLRIAPFSHGKRIDPHLLNDGGFKFRSCELLYARSLRRLSDRTMGWILASASYRAADRWYSGCACRALWAAQCP